MPGQAPCKPRGARSVIIGTAGHIDHGKTALVRALTGIDTDRLPEEKHRGITIDLGFASLDTQAPDGSSLSLSFVDVPGHARFVRNMLAGAGGVDMVLLVISAEEGVMPQTEEHLAICTLLGIECGITVLTKADAVSEERLREAERSVRDFVKGTFLESGSLFVVSARTGSRLAELRGELIRCASGIPARNQDGAPRFPIDRAFVIKGFGTVVTGTLMGGSIRSGIDLAVEPGGRIARVRGLQTHGRAEAEASAGTRVALNLARIEAADLKRGDTLVEPNSFTSVSVLDVELRLLPGAPPLKHRARVHFHAFAAECIATATLYDAVSVQPGETKLARLRLSEPVVLLPDDRFVVRAGASITTVGGGRVLDAHPAPRVSKSRTAAWLRALGSAPPGERVWLRIARRGTGGISNRELSRETGVAESALGRLMERWVAAGRVHRAGETCLITKDAFATAQETLLRHFRTRSGNRFDPVRRAELREQTGLRPEIFDEALRSLERNRQVQVAGEFVKPLTSGAAPGRDSAETSTIAAEYARAGIAPPSPDELGMRLGITPAEMRRLITLLLREGTVVRLGNDSLCIDRRALEGLADKVRALRGQTLDVAAFKQLAGVSRKYAIPILEYLDRERVTVRQGTRRLVL